MNIIIFETRENYIWDKILNNKIARILKLEINNINFEI